MGTFAVLAPLGGIFGFGTLVMCVCVCQCECECEEQSIK